MGFVQLLWKQYILKAITNVNVLSIGVSYKTKQTNYIHKDSSAVLQRINYAFGDAGSIIIDKC